MYKYAAILAEKIGADIEIVEIAALLHDLGRKNPAWKKEHHVFGAIEAERILNAIDYPVEKIEKVKSCIINHRGSRDSDRVSKEEHCIADADAISHIIGVSFFFKHVYSRKQLNLKEGKKWIKDKITRSYNKMSDIAKEMIEVEYKALQSILS